MSASGLQTECSIAAAAYISHAGFSPVWVLHSFDCWLLLALLLYSGRTMKRKRAKFTHCPLVVECHYTRSKWRWGMPIFADMYHKSVTIATSLERAVAIWIKATNRKSGISWNSLLTSSGQSKTSAVMPCNWQMLVGIISLRIYSAPIRNERTQQQRKQNTLLQCELNRTTAEIADATPKCFV